MKRFTFHVVVLCLLCLFPMRANAQTVKVCNEKSGLAWEMNTEADMDHYTVYHNDAANVAIGGVGVEKIEVPHDTSKGTVNSDGTTTFTHQLTLSKEGMRYFVVTASDKVGNESPTSNEVNCNVDLSPGSPTIRLEFNIASSPPSP